MLRGGAGVIADPELVGEAGDGPYRTRLVVLRRLGDAAPLIVDEIEHVRVDRAERSQIGARTIVAGDEPAQETPLAEERRVVEIDDERPIGLDHQDRILVLVVDAQATQRLARVAAIAGIA